MQKTEGLWNLIQTFESINFIEGYSCSDLTSLCKRGTALEPIRELGMSVASIPPDQVRPINAKDFTRALDHIRPSVSQEHLQMYEKWNIEFGSS